MKTCSNCKTEKDADEFYNTDRYCKRCRLIKAAERYAKKMKGDKKKYIENGKNFDEIARKFNADPKHKFDVEKTLAFANHEFIHRRIPV